MNPNIPKAEDELPVCAFCGSHGKLVDLRDQAKLLGKTYPDGDSPYVVTCCGYFLAIASEEERQRLIAHLKATEEISAEASTS